MVQVIQVDHVDTEPSQACLTRLMYVCRIRPYIEPASNLIPPYQPKLAGQHHLPASPLDRPPDQLLILVSICGIHHDDAHIKGSVDHAYGIAVRPASRFIAQPHSTESLTPEIIQAQSWA